MLSNEPIQVPPDELMTSAAIGLAAAEVGRILSRALIDAVSTRG